MLLTFFSGTTILALIVAIFSARIFFVVLRGPLKIKQKVWQLWWQRVFVIGVMLSLFFTALVGFWSSACYIDVFGDSTCQFLQETTVTHFFSNFIFSEAIFKFVAFLLPEIFAGALSMIIAPLMLAFIAGLALLFLVYIFRICIPKYPDRSGFIHGVQNLWKFLISNRLTSLIIISGMIIGTLVLNHFSETQVVVNVKSLFIQPGQPLHPRIDWLEPSSGPKGTIIEISGINLSGFEGDLAVIFERKDGKKIKLYDGFASYQNTKDKLIKVRVVEPCQKGNIVVGRYSGVETLCSYIEFTHGIYKVYVEPWGVKSNAVYFTLID